MPSQKKTRKKNRGKELLHIKQISLKDTRIGNNDCFILKFPSNKAPQYLSQAYNRIRVF